MQGLPKLIDRGGPNEVGGIPSEAPGRATSQEGACRGLDIRAAKFVSRLSEFQASEFHTKDRMLLDRKGAGGPEGKKAKDGKGAPPGGRELVGRELASLSQRRVNAKQGFPEFPSGPENDSRRVPKVPRPRRSA